MTQQDLIITETHRDTISNNAPGLKPSYFRLLFYHKNAAVFSFFATMVAVATLTYAYRFAADGHIVVSVLLAGGGVLFSILGVCGWLGYLAAIRSDSLAIRKGLLTPAIASPDRLKMHTMASLGNGSGATYYGVQELHCKPITGETEIVCSSTFLEGMAHDRWGRYDSIPLRVGCSDAAGIDASHARIQPEHWEELKRIAKDHEIPGFGEMLLLNEAYEVIQVVGVRLRDLRG